MGNIEGKYFVQIATEEIANKITKFLNFNINECEDSYIGIYDKKAEAKKISYIVENSGTFGKHIKKRLSDEKRHSCSIAIVLESPHIDEFEKEYYLPAQGVTGINIRNHLEDMLAQISLSNNKYDIF